MTHYKKEEKRKPNWITENCSQHNWSQQGDGIYVLLLRITWVRCCCFWNVFFSVLSSFVFVNLKESDFVIYLFLFEIDVGHEANWGYINECQCYRSSREPLLSLLLVVIVAFASFYFAQIIIKFVVFYGHFDIRWIDRLVKIRQTHTAEWQNSEEKTTKKRQSFGIAFCQRF